ncbi:TetR/AcrR family transcriptional regulator [Streptomyces sp. So13.3]|uniref:TetR/AcrR family transcriptional regulator n=1 Tax=Streptomyces TaxID=1883 RepID=UPI0011059310|nr:MULTISPECIES: TetR/AcrR family transcriptional regulator [Streptomyces]MCZ4095282.1 TetR/AcrR family transcriptional regulator [Streptomyces sp. H39-C1]QNA71014.1 TetR/AcrR family transcriptional regulator [Streptomyces sp. So13.3]
MPERRRGAALEKALLDAAWEELVANGYARFTMDAVVQRAGTSPPVLYRRWSDRDELVRATIVRSLEENRLDVPDTGSLRGDVLTLMREINATRVQFITVMSVHLAGYYQETGTSPRDLLATGRENSVDVLFDRAVDRGEIKPELLTERIKSLPFDLLRQEVLTTFAPVPDHVLEEIVDTVFLPLVR